MRLLALTGAVAAALALGCGASGSGSSTSGLRGRVMRGPVTPGPCRVGQSCEEPARGVKLLFWRASRVVSRTTTNQNGWYRIALRPGTYTVRTNRPGFERIPQPSRARVFSGRFRRLDFNLDTGIR